MTESRLRNIIMRIRVNDEEAARLKAGAEAADVTEARFVRQAALDKCGVTATPDDTIAALSAVGSQLRRLVEIAAASGMTQETETELQQALRLTITAITMVATQAEVDDDRENARSRQIA